MKRITFNKQFMVLMFLLLSCFASYAADEDLITKQITIKLTEAGTLPNKIASSKKNLVTNLKIIGEINGTDLRFLREMAGSDEYGKSTFGNLSILDLSETRIVEGGYNYRIIYNGDYLITSNDTIGAYAFDDCTSLTSIKIPSGVKEIGTYAFDNCISLTSVIIQSGVKKIGRLAFNGCSYLTSINIPSSVTEIGMLAFNNCKSLTSVNIPSSVTEIGDGAFIGCSSLTTVDIPSSVKTIRSFTFYNCESLISVKIPSSVTEIGENAFRGCNSLKSIYVYAEDVPFIYSSTFGGFDSRNCTLYVPNGTSDSYSMYMYFGNFKNIVEFDATSIHNTVATPEAQETARYATNGQRLTAPINGINLVKYSDGTVKKLFVK